MEFGYLLRKPSGQTFIVNYLPTAEMWNWVEVDPDTVGQYTGMNDRDGTMIFEGDICDFCVFDCFGGDTQHRAEVLYSEDAFVLRTANEETLELGWIRRQDDEFRVVGNIHDSPELARGGERS